MDSIVANDLVNITRLRITIPLKVVKYVCIYALKTA